MKQLIIAAVELALVVGLLPSDGLAAGAGNWSPSVNISNSPGDSGQWGAAIAIDGEGSLHVVWEDDTPGNFDIMYATKPASGSWSTPVNISNNSGWSYAADIAVDSGGAIHAVWGDLTPDPPTNREILYATKPLGEPWSAPINISNNSNSSTHPSIVVDSDDTVHVVWHDMTPNPSTGNTDIMYAYRPRDEPWSTAVDISNHPDLWEQTPKLAVDASRTVHVVWPAYLDGALGFYSSKPYAGSWSAPVAIPLRIGDAAIDGEGTLHVVAGETDSSQGEIFYAAKPAGGPWSTPENISNASPWSERPAIAIKSDNSVHVVWIEMDAPPPFITFAELVYVAGPDGWSAPAKVSDTDGYSGWPAIAADSWDNLHAVWSDYIPDNPEQILYASSEAPIPAPVGGIEELPDVAESAGGSSSLPFGAMAGIAAAGAVVLMAGGWFARRRWRAG